MKNSELYVDWRKLLLPFFTATIFASIVGKIPLSNIFLFFVYQVFFLYLLTFDNNYFNALYQGIPISGYTKMFEKILKDVEVKLNTDYLEDRDYWDSQAKKNYIYRTN